jgi:putative salt-induced outer membrane protein YdiY
MYYRNPFTLFVCLFFLSLIFIGTANADVLVLKNGDRITGDIKRIWDAEISIEPEYADEFEVDLSAVEYIESDKEFEIDLNGGREIVASFAGADSDGNQVVKSDDESISVPVADLFELEEIEDEFEWESNVEASATLNRGNTDTTNTMFRADGMVRFNDHRHFGEVTYFREDLAGVQTKEQDLFKYSYNFLFKDPWFFSADLSFERDPIIELDSRVIVSAGIGRDIWDTPGRTLNVRLGAGFQQEEISSNTTDSSVATWTLRYRQDFFGDDVELFHNQTITWNVSGRTNTSYRTSTGLGYEISDLLTTNVSLNYDYETEPVDVAKNEDIALLFGLKLEF